MTTGPLGQGVAMAVGMAIAERHLNAVYGDDLVDHRTYVIAGDGDLMEGVNHEAVGLAGHLKLGRLIVLWDDNQITIDGSTDLSRTEDVVARHQACGWHTVECDGLDVGQRLAGDRRRPTPIRGRSLIRCKTIIGYGAPNKQGTAATHGAALGQGRGRGGASRARAGAEGIHGPRRRAHRVARGGQARRRCARRVERAARGQRQEGRIPRPHRRQGRRSAG